MEEKKEEKTQEKLSYEQLEQYAAQVSAQAQHMYSKLQESNMQNLFKRLDYLFKVIENMEAFSTEFVSNCIAEIEAVMTVPKEETEKE